MCIWLTQHSKRPEIFLMTILKKQVGINICVVYWAFFYLIPFSLEEYIQFMPLDKSCNYFSR